MTKLINILDTSSCLPPEVIEDYVKGNLSTSEQRKVECHLIDCPFCDAEAAGLAAMQNPDELPLLIENINEKIDARAKSKKLFFHYLKSPTAIAALILLLLGVGIILRYTVFNTYQNTAIVSKLDKTVVEDTKVISNENNIDALYGEKDTASENISEIKSKELENNKNTPDKSSEEELEEKPNSNFDLEKDDELDENTPTVLNEAEQEKDMSEEALEDEEVKVGKKSDPKEKQNTNSNKLPPPETSYAMTTPENDASVDKSEDKKDNKIVFGRGRNLPDEKKKNKKEIPSLPKILSPQKQYEQAVKTYENKDFKSAQKLFDAIIKKKNKYLYDALWYRGLLFEQLGQKAEAKNCFNKVKNSNSKYSEKAKSKLE